MQISFQFDEKFRSTSKNVDQFYFVEKLRSTSRKDVDSFYFDEKLISTSKKGVDPFYFDEKTQIYIQERCRSVLFFEKKNQSSTRRSLKLRNRSNTTYKSRSF